MNLQATTRRYFGVINLVLLAAAAYFQAAGISQVIGGSLASPWLAGGSDRPRAPPSPPPDDDHATFARAILDRNPFDSTASRPLDALHPGGDGRSSSDMHGCEGFKALIAVASSNPAWSVAVISGGPDPGNKLVRVGDEFAGKTVERVEWNRVVLSSASGSCEMVMFQTRKAPDPRNAVSAPPIDSGGVPLAIASKIQRLGPTEFNLDRLAIGEMIENQAELMKHFRIAPVQEKGRIVGLQLFGVRPGTILDALGFESGDRLETINGFDMTSPESAMQAYARLRTADHLTVGVTRRGQKTNLDYNVK